ncbi:MAG: hypothetical protein A2992_02390 [Elusimicrobia bacterium RIFCSPLOWO2_01_FULL_59_12]|nr:MAG: hypothetical protein A2992_02390 [Elusimicrobia bacterium RIFCSPLOWO2_01_FULL_59_12]
MVRARRIDSYRGRFKNADQAASCEVLAGFGQFDFKRVAGTSIGHKYDGVARPAQSVAAQGKAVDPKR